MKAIISLLLALILILGLAACKKSELKVEGGDMYYVSSANNISSNFADEIIESSSIPVYVGTASYVRPTTDWDSVIDGVEPYYFLIVNKTDDEITKIGYRPYGYKDYITFDVSLKPKETTPITFSQGDTAIYKQFEFVFTTAYGKTIKLNPLAVNNKKGIEISSLNDEYKYKYTK